MMDIMFLSYGLLFISCLLLTYVSVYIVLTLVTRYRIMDVPNARSNHTLPTPRGAGLGIMVVLLPSLCLLSVMDMRIEQYIPLYACAALLSLFSFIDDVKSLSVVIRFIAQIIAVIVGIYLVYDDGKQLFAIYISVEIEMVIVGLLWVWFINLYNFMDGIDGITACETFFIAAGIFVYHVISPFAATFLPVWCVAIAGCTVGFYIWNRSPARIFLGDSGSILLGYLLGFMLIQCALDSHLAVALLIPLYYLMDSSITLLKRMVNGEKIWQAHSQHYYQQAVRSGASHQQVIIVLAALNSIVVFLVALASFMPTLLWPCFFIGIVLVSLVLNWFATYE